MRLHATAAQRDAVVPSVALGKHLVDETHTYNI